VFVHAYVDESYDLTIGVYILTASIVDFADTGDIRCILHSLQRGGEKLHWSKEPTHRRAEIIKAVCGMATTVAVLGHSASLRPERARRKCMEALLPELESGGVTNVLFEARQAQHNKHDREMIASCRRKRLLSAKLAVSFVPGVLEPMLWLPDIACGALLAAQRGDLSYSDQLGDKIRLVHIDGG
jgi:hypothetical protein